MPLGNKKNEEKFLFVGQQMKQLEIDSKVNNISGEKREKAAEQAYRSR